MEKEFLNIKWVHMKDISRIFSNMVKDKNLSLMGIIIKDSIEMVNLKEKDFTSGIIIQLTMVIFKMGWDVDMERWLKTMELSMKEILKRILSMVSLNKHISLGRNFRESFKREKEKMVDYTTQMVYKLKLYKNDFDIFM